MVESYLLLATECASGWASLPRKRVHCGDEISYSLTTDSGYYTDWIYLGYSWLFPEFYVTETRSL